MINRQVLTALTVQTAQGDENIKGVHTPQEGEDLAGKPVTFL